ncbi:hypothetical protein GCM10023192_05330 [Amycolatopsis samaneae]
MHPTHPGRPSDATPTARFSDARCATPWPTGIRQFVDIGSGLPTAGQVHKIADHAVPGECRVVYIDNEPIAYADTLLGQHADRRRYHAPRGSARLRGSVAAGDPDRRNRPGRADLPARGGDAALRPAGTGPGVPA